jgi:hypothetical protein
MDFNSIPFVALAKPAQTNPMVPLLAASTFGMVLDPGDQNVTRCYVETTGLSATTLCADGDQIGTIRCMVTNRFIAFPTGTRPVYRTDGPRAYILTTSTTQRIFWTGGSTFTGGGRLAFAFAGMQLTEVTGADNAMLVSAILNDNAYWNDVTRAGVQLWTPQTRLWRGFGISHDAGAGLEPDFAATFLAGPADVVSTSKKSGASRTTGSASVSGSPAWAVNRATFTCSDPGEGVRFEGRVYFAAVFDVATADAPALAATIQTRAEAAMGI